VRTAPDPTPPRRPADRVSAAFEACPRTHFLRRRDRHDAGQDHPLPIGYGQTSSQPSTVATMLRLLDVHPGARVLDVGSGSGWTTALLAHLTGPQGSVVGVELVPELAAWGGQNLAATHQPWAQVVVAQEGVLGVPAEAPFDRILVSAEARRLPQELVDQLAAGGRMVLPVLGEMLVVTREGPGPEDLLILRFGAYRFVPLR
jgi:protein-L-isoaspartate(D-aspartate) O-methyltransferase